jgi:hypothetical protein
MWKAGLLVDRAQLVEISENCGAFWLVIGLTIRAWWTRS